MTLDGEADRRVDPQLGYLSPRRPEHWQIDYEGWREAFETKSVGPMRVTEALLENVAASERKQIAAISTQHGFAARRCKGIGGAGGNVLPVSKQQNSVEHGHIHSGERVGAA